MSGDKSFDIEVLSLGPMDNFIYLIHDRATKQAAVVDPAWDVEKIIELANAKQVTITDVLLTHTHADHVNGLDQLLKTYDAQVHLLKYEAQFWGRFEEAPTAHHGGDIIKVGDTEIKILHTPGHTPGSACYHLGDQLIAGDTMFVYGCGRCDLPGGDPNQMHDTLRRIAIDLPKETCVLPGHDYAEKPSVTLAEQIAGNPFMHFDAVEDFVQYRMHDHDKVRDAPYHPMLKT